MAEYTIDKIEYGSNVYILQDNVSNYFPKSGGTVTGATTFNSTLSANGITTTTLTATDSVSVTNGITAANFNGGQPIYAVKGTQTGATGTWLGSINVPALYDGLTIAYYLPYNGSGNATLNLTLSGGSNTGAINVYYTGASRLNTQYVAGSTILLTYWSAGSISVGGTATTDNRWTRADYNIDNQIPYSSTAAGTAAKVFTCTNYKLLDKSYVLLNLINGNSYAGAITFNINSTGAKSVYINGNASSSSNYSLTEGIYLAYYNGTNFYIRTDGQLTGGITAGTLGSSTASSGSTISIPYANYNSAGQITGVGTHTHTVTGFLTSSSTLDSTKLSGSIPVASYTFANYNTTGAIKPWFSTSGASSGVTATAFSNSPTISGRTTTSGRYYAIEIDSNGRLFVNVPWISYSNATTSAAGLMSSTDKSKLDGMDNLVNGTGTGSIKQVNATASSGTDSVALGNSVSATANYAQAQNLGTTTAMIGQTAMGTYNIADSAPATAVHPSGTTYGNYALVVGNGTGDSDRSNAFTVDWLGGVEMDLDVVVDSETELATSGSDMDLYNAIINLGWSDCIV